MSVQYRIQNALLRLDVERPPLVLVRLSPEAMGQLKREINPDLASITEVVSACGFPVEMDYSLPPGVVVLRHEVRA